jgi:DNA-binding phage protein
MTSVAAETGMSRRAVYDAMIKAKPGQPS